MRVRTRWADERGVAAVIVVLLLAVLIGITALAIDGGLLWAKFRRVRNANDAAALAAALSCARGEGQSVADAKADEYAAANVWDAARIEDPVYTPDCNPNGGKVTVRYGGEQTLMFAPAVGLDSPRPVHAYATASWGGAGGSADVIPLVLMRDRLSTCNFVPGPGVTPPPEGTLCGFWWDNDDLGNATWGYLNLASWPDDETEDVATTSGCSAGGGEAAMSDAIINGIDEPLLLIPPPPTYVCAENGAYSQPIDNAIQTALAPPISRTVFALPVSDPALSVYTCTNNACTPYRYAIIGFAFVTPIGLFRRTEPEYQTCQGAVPPEGDSANSRCLVAEYLGFSNQGLIPGGGQNFGFVPVTLSG
jgi:Flp pilus assembly protein TadG